MKNKSGKIVAWSLAHNAPSNPGSKRDDGAYIGVVVQPLHDDKVINNVYHLLRSAPIMESRV